METQTGRETERVKAQNTGLQEMVIWVVLLMEIDMAEDLWDLRERGQPLEKLVREDLDSTEVVQQVICGKGGSIQEEQAPAADSS